MPNPPSLPSGEPALDLNAINASQLDQVSDVPDIKTITEELDVERGHKQAQLESYKQDTQERKKYAARIFWVCAYWVTAIFLLLVLNGFGAAIYFKLSDSVLLAAIGSTTANILGIFYIVARYLFPKRND